MPDDPEPNFQGNPRRGELLLRWLRYLRGAVIRKMDGLSETDARWTPEGGLTPLIGIVNHLTHVEWRWIDGAMLGVETSRSEAEFTPGPEPAGGYAAITSRRAGRGDRLCGPVDAIPFQPTRLGDGTDLRFVLVHLINETARPAGHRRHQRGSCSTARRESEDRSSDLFVQRLQIAPDPRGGGHDRSRGRRPGAGGHRVR